MSGPWGIRNDLTRFAVAPGASVSTVATAFASNRVNTVLRIESDGRCTGCISRGDLIRQIAQGDTGDAPAKWNTGFARLRQGDDPEAYLAMLGRKLGNVVPAVDARGRCVRVLERTDQLRLRVGGQEFTPRERPLTIAEIGNNHNGDSKRARALVDAAAAAGAGAVKFQARVLASLYARTDEDYLRKADYSTAYTVRQLKRFNLPLNELAELMDYARELGLLAVCTPFDDPSMQWLLDYKPDAIKIASSDFTNTHLHAPLDRFAGPVLMSTGMNRPETIRKVSSQLRRRILDCTLLHTNSTYPTPFEDVHLSFMDTLRDWSPSGLVGYSGHERGIHLPLVAASMGAVVIEKHLTLDRSLEGNDHKVSLLPDELATLCAQLRDLALATDNASPLDREISPGEAINAIALEKGIYLAHDARRGDAIGPDDVIIRSPRIGLSPLEFDELERNVLCRDRAAGEALTRSDFSHAGSARRPEFQLLRLGRFGLPARIRDCATLSRRFNPAFLEYHLFSTDLEVDVSQHAVTLEGQRFVFHAPEQFDDGFVLDLVTEHATYRDRSEALLGRCVEWCRSVADLSGVTDSVALVVNVGGAAKRDGIDDGFDREHALRRLARLCARYADQGVTLMPQTMPPFPWHFGGQAYHRLLVDPQDVHDAQAFGRFDVCLDLSHTFLACEHLGIDFYDAIAALRSLVSHCHVSDARPPNGEGMQIGDGVIDFVRVDQILQLSDGDIPWIPEVWNGHLDDFIGFRQGLERLAEEFQHAD